MNDDEKKEITVAENGSGDEVCIQDALVHANRLIKNPFDRDCPGCGGKLDSTPSTKPGPKLGDCSLMITLYRCLKCNRHWED